MEARRRVGRIPPQRKTGSVDRLPPEPYRIRLHVSACYPYNGKILFRHLDMLESRRMKRRIVLIALLLLCGAACGKNVAPKTILVQNQRGLAAWYGHGDGHHGKITANGERFDKNKLTAAHFTLPFGTKVRVHNLQNGRKVVVRINDRFPVETLQKGRIIDLSYGAAKKLRMVRAGIVSVLLEIISLPK